MTTTTVTELLAQEAVEKYGFRDIHFWNKLTSGEYQYSPLNYPRCRLTEWVQGFEEATCQALLKEIDPTGHYAAHVRNASDARVRAASLNRIVEHLMKSAAELVKPKY